MWWSDAEHEFTAAEKNLTLAREYTTAVEKYHSASERFLKAAIVGSTRMTPPRIHYLPDLVSESAKRHGAPVPGPVGRSARWLQNRYERYPPRRTYARRRDAVAAREHAGNIRGWARGLVSQWLSDRKR